MPADTIISVIVLTYNSRDVVLELLQELLRERLASVRISLVDNASSDGTRELVRKRFPDIPIIRYVRNLGYGRAYTQACAKEFLRGAEYALLLNPDVRLGPNFFPRFLASVRAEKLDAATPLYVLPGGKGISPLQRTLLARSPSWDADVRRGTLADVYDAPLLIGAALLMNRHAFTVTGGFDPTYFLYFEDFDFCRLARAAGLRLGVVTTAHVFHSDRSLATIERWRLQRIAASGLVYALSDSGKSLAHNFLEGARHIRGLAQRLVQNGNLRALPLLLRAVALVMGRLPTVLKKRAAQRRLLAQLRISS